MRHKPASRSGGTRTCFGIKSSRILHARAIIGPKLQLLSGHSDEKSLAIYRDLALTDVAADYEAAMHTFPGR